MDLSQLVPPSPLHWTSIVHYLVLVMALVMLFTSGDKSPVVFLFVLAVLALSTGADLYVGVYQIARLIIFLLRVLMVGLPIMLAGMAPTEDGRAVGIITAVLAAPIFVITFITCLLPWGLGDPRVARWCEP